MPLGDRPRVQVLESVGWLGRGPGLVVVEEKCRLGGWTWVRDTFRGQGQYGQSQIMAEHNILASLIRPVWLPL